MNQFTHKTLATAMGAAVIGLAAMVASADALAQRDHGGPHNQGQDCETWLDGRPERNVPPRCRELAGQLNQVRRATSAFYSYDVAIAANWDTILGGCVESPMGGMGYHVHNMDQLNNGVLTLLRPEVLLYAPMEDGSMEFLGVEYIIPGNLWKSQDPPELLGQQLHFNRNVGPFGIWALHVWTAKHNPEGIFAAWNPEVSCEFAPPPPPPPAD